MDPVDIPTIFVPVTIVNVEDPVRHIMDLLNAGYDAAQALSECVDGDWVVELQVVRVYRATSKFILEVVDGESSNAKV
jgi:hypothetical protein